MHLPLHSPFPHQGNTTFNLERVKLIQDEETEDQDKGGDREHTVNFFWVNSLRMLKDGAQMPVTPLTSNPGNLERKGKVPEAARYWFSPALNSRKLVEIPKFNFILKIWKKSKIQTSILQQELILV